MDGLLGRPADLGMGRGCGDAWRGDGMRAGEAFALEGLSGLGRGMRGRGRVGVEGRWVGVGAHGRRRENGNGKRVGYNEICLQFGGLCRLVRGFSSALPCLRTLQLCVLPREKNQWFYRPASLCRRGGRQAGRG
jgi:hypothetical protein